MKQKTKTKVKRKSPEILIGKGNRLQPNANVLANARAEIETLLSDIKKIQKKGITPIESRYLSYDGFPTDFHTHLRFTRICLGVLKVNVSDVVIGNMELLAEEEDRENQK